MFDCVVYVSSVANFSRHPRKVACLESFATGVRNQGYRVHVELGYKYHQAKLAVILGWINDKGGGLNIDLRRQVISEQSRLKKHTMCIDASCWKYVDNYGKYLRYSVGGPFYDRAQYLNKNSDGAKWQEISSALGVSLKPYQNNANGHILLCMQRDGGFAMKNLNPFEWTVNKIKEIRKHTNRKIMVRPHPGAYDMKQFTPMDSFFNANNVEILHPERSKLIDNLQGAHSAVFFNSSASVAALCEGVPIFVDDASCVSWTVANTDISKIESPTTLDRQQWIWDLAAAHWSDEDSQQGLIWKKFLPLVA